MSRKIAITTASGQLAAEIIRATIPVVDRENVVGLARTPDKTKSLGVEVRLGEILESVIAVIYEGIRNCAANNESQFSLAAGRDHQSWQDFFDGLKSRKG